MSDTAAAAPKKLFLLDAFALIYRSHFAFSKNPRINSKGMNTGLGQFGSWSQCWDYSSKTASKKGEDTP